MQEQLAAHLAEIIPQEYPNSIITVYLYGSQARGRPRVNSDVDVALLLREDVTPRRARDVQLEIMSAVERITRREVDVIVLNHVPPLLRFQVFKYGRILYERDKDKRCLMQMRYLSGYYDFKYYLDYYHAALIERIRKEGLGRGYRGRNDALAEVRRVSAQVKTVGADAA